MTTLGVLADTHSPDRSPALNPQVVEYFKAAEVTAILHAGDVSIPRVLKDLEAIAPVYAVRGNRDIFALHHLPLKVRLDFKGVSIGLAHRHGTFSRYMVDTLHRQVYGCLVERYVKRMLQTFPDVDVIVFGHLHIPCNLYIDGKLVFNPGTTTHPWPRYAPATYGFLHLEKGKIPLGEILELQ